MLAKLILVSHGLYCRYASLAWDQSVEILSVEIVAIYRIHEWSPLPTLQRLVQTTKWCWIVPHACWGRSTAFNRQLSRWRSGRKKWVTVERAKILALRRECRFAGLNYVVRKDKYYCNFVPDYVLVDWACTYVNDNLSCALTRALTQYICMGECLCKLSNYMYEDVVFAMKSYIIMCNTSP